MNHDQQLIPGRLWSLLQQRRREALASGALQPIETAQEFVDDGGVRFLARIVSSLARKTADRERQVEQRQVEQRQVEQRQVEQRQVGQAPFNPFLPYEPALFVTGLSETHLALLNKFNVIDHHLLIVTRCFVHQETLLDLADFEALCFCLAEYEGLGFYNGGAAAGASQPHKHLQVAPLPLVESGPALPIDPLLRAVHHDATIGTVPGLPFHHGFATLDRALATRPRAFAAVLHERYRTLLPMIGIDAIRVGDDMCQSAPYNLLVTRDWLLLVPRCREDFAGISINALGFAGSLFVKNREQLATLRSRGPMAVLRAVTPPDQTAPLKDLAEPGKRIGSMDSI